MNYFFVIVFLFGLNLGAEEESKPLLRVFPIYRIEECEWAIRFDICLKCIRKKESYAQRIRFLENEVFREHGCYTDSKGFYILE